ncbi:MAG: hypothetical protein J6K91_09690 [Opitutales bacterium]|nr:hypothetical protein [Opitutales bacterium]MBR7106059.1 hypothetical protein [Opitutales bacterium]
MSIPAYFIIGSATSGRCGVCASIIEKALNDDDFCGVFISNNEEKTQFDKRIASAQNAGFINYSDADDAREKISQLDANRFTHVFYIADSTKNLADEIEEFKKTVDCGYVKLARIWGVLDCATILKYPRECMPYADALAHFSDCLLLSRRSNISNKDVEDLKSRYEKLRYPMMTEYVNKKFEVSRPIELLIDEARRISMLFDDIDPIDELDFDDDDIPDEPFDLTRKPDPYMERLANGARIKTIPDISEYARKMRAEEQSQNEKV